MSDIEEERELDVLVERFTHAESGLRKIVEAAEGLTTAREELHGARDDIARTREESLERLELARRTIREELEAAEMRDLERLEATVSAIERRLGKTEREMVGRLDRAEASLDTSQRSLADLTSAIYGLTNELKDTARDLKDTAIAFRALDSSGTLQRIERIESGQSRAQMLLATVIVGLAIVAVLVLV